MNYGDEFQDILISSLFLVRMLDYKTIQYKPHQFKTYDDGTRVEFKDLLAKTWDTWGGEPYINPLVINEYYVGRPDLISLAVYGSDEYADMICKFNGISNPFDLNEGMLIFIPPQWWAQSGIEDRETSPCDIIKSSESIHKRDEVKKMRNDVRSSSTPTVGDPQPYVIDKTLGLVFY